MWTSKTVEIWWLFLHEACSGVCWPLRWALQRWAWVMQDVGSGQRNRRKLGAVGEITQSKINTWTHSTPCLMDIWVRWEGGKMFGWFEGFFTLLWSFSPTLEVRKLACGITSPSSSVSPRAPSSQAISISKARAILQAFLLLSTPNSNTALILVTCEKQPTPFLLLVWYWRYKLNPTRPQSLGRAAWRVQKVFWNTVIQAESQLVKLHSPNSGCTCKENTILISRSGQIDKFSGFIHDFC